MTAHTIVGIACIAVIDLNKAANSLPSIAPMNSEAKNNPPLKATQVSGVDHSNNPVEIYHPAFTRSIIAHTPTNEIMSIRIMSIARSSFVMGT